MPDTTYEKIPVFRTNNLLRPEDVIGRARVVISEDGKTTVVMELGEVFTEFLNMGDLKSLTLSGFVSNVDPAKAKEFWSKQP